jgi:hypothetical protein
MLLVQHNTDVLPGYRVGDDGSVSRYLKRRKQWVNLKITNDGNVCVSRGGCNTTLSVGRLVLFAFAPGARGIGERVLHFPDPDPRNNRLDNLRWATPNAQRAGDPAMAEYGRMSRSGKQSRILTDAQATEALEMLATGVTTEDVAEAVDVNRGVIDRLIAGSYPHLPRPDGITPIGQRRLRGAAHPCSRSEVASTLYDPPSVAIGDRIYCAIRRREVTILALSATGWPLTRDRPGRSGYVLCDELAEAVTRESSSVVGEMIGVSPSAVQKWRKLLDASGTAYQEDLP